MRNHHHFVLAIDGFIQPGLLVNPLLVQNLGVEEQGDGGGEVANDRYKDV